MNDPSRRFKAGDGDTGIPRWVKVAGAVVGLLVLLAVVVMLMSGGGHTPRRHGGDPSSTPPASVPAGHTPPTGGHG
ncbi:hypothetical protein [Actinomadura sp. 6N118]|uniref:hypothetical protein n=1 Tax=Actinomadura sp. 6N118 TaxID=3375151 RepID=UPI0037B280E9